MVVYRLIGRTNPYDWAARSEDMTLGLFHTKEGAERKIALLKSKENWKAQWILFKVFEDAVLD